MMTVTDYLDSLIWDDTPRLDRWLVDYAGAKSSPYVHAAGRLMLVAAVRRACEPGCLFDELPLLIGKPNSGRIRALRVLAGKKAWIADDVSLEDAQRFMEATEGKWIVVLRKFQRVLQSSDGASFKAILTRQQDLGPGDIRVPRPFVIIGTMSMTDAFSTSTSGNRRIWPIHIQCFDLNRLRIDRDQLWAEAAKAATDSSALRIDPKLFSEASQLD